MSKFSSYERLDPKCDLAFRAQAAIAGVTADDPRSTDNRDRLLEIRNAARKVASVIERKTSEKGYTFAESDVGVLAACTARVAYVDAALDLQDSFAASRGNGAQAGMVNIEGRRLPIITAADRGNVAQRFRAAGLAVGDAGNPEQPTFDDFLRGVMGAKVRPEVATFIRNSMSEGTGSAGGYTVPAIIIPQIIESLLPNSSLLQAGMQLVPLQGAGSSFSYPVETGTPTWNFYSEGGAITPSDPTYTTATLTPRHARVKTLMSRELLQDSLISFDQAMQSVFARSLAAFLDLHGLTGSGTPPDVKGLANVAGIGSYTLNSPNGISAADYTWPVQALTTLYAANAKPPFSCVLHPNQLLKLQGLKSTTNDSLRAPQIVTDGLKFCPTSALPINVTCGTSSDTAPAYVGNYGDFVCGMRLDLQLLRADQVAADNAQVAYYAFARVDFAVLRPAQFCKVLGLRA